MQDLYFAYGSNLDLDDWRDWCARNHLPAPAVRFVANAYLPDHGLAYTRYAATRGGGVLDIAASPGAVVPGVVFAVEDPQTWATLDQKEGAPAAYRRLPLHALTDAGEVLAVQTYAVAEPLVDVHVAPTAAYLESLNRGLRRWALDGQWHHRAAAGGSPAALPYVFTYGTLRPGEPNAHLLGPVPAVPARVPGLLHSLGAYPVLTPAQADGEWVVGELVRVPDLADRLGALDELEEFRGYRDDSLYLRVLITAHTPAGKQLAWVWRKDAAPAAALAIPSGDWLDRAR